MFAMELHVQVGRGALVSPQCWQLSPCQVWGPLQAGLAFLVFEALAPQC